MLISIYETHHKSLDEINPLAYVNLYILSFFVQIAKNEILTLVTRASLNEEEIFESGRKQKKKGKKTRRISDSEVYRRYDKERWRVLVEYKEKSSFG